MEALLCFAEIDNYYSRRVFDPKTFTKNVQTR